MTIFWVFKWSSASICAGVICDDSRNTSDAPMAAGVSVIGVTAAVAATLGGGLTGASSTIVMISLTSLLGSSAMTAFARVIGLESLDGSMIAPVVECCVEKLLVISGSPSSAEGWLRTHRMPRPTPERSKKSTAMTKILTIGWSPCLVSGGVASAVVGFFGLPGAWWGRGLSLKGVCFCKSPVGRKRLESFSFCLDVSSSMGADRG